MTTNHTLYKNISYVVCRVVKFVSIYYRFVYTLAIVQTTYLESLYMRIPFEETLFL